MAGTKFHYKLVDLIGGQQIDRIYKKFQPGHDSWD